MPWPACAACGLRVALGTDSANTGGRHDLFEIMRLAVMLPRREGGNPAAWPRLADTPVIKDLMILDPKAIGNMTKLDFAKINLSQWNDRWNRTMSQ